MSKITKEAFLKLKEDTENNDCVQFSSMTGVEFVESNKIKIEDTKESDLSYWGKYINSYLLDILKGEYDLEEAREDFLSTVNSKKYGRGNE